MKNIHLSVQGKGGCGKSTDAIFIAQYLIDQGKHPLCIDVDSLNRSFSAYKNLNVYAIELLKDGKIQGEGWDAMLNLILKSKDDAVVDAGANSFYELLNYMLGLFTDDFLQENHLQFYMHIPIVGGAGMDATLSGMSQIIDSCQKFNAKFVIWLNNYFGVIERNGQQFEQVKEYLERKSKITALIKIPDFSSSYLHNKVLNFILTEKITFDDALAVDTRVVSDPETGEETIELYSIKGFDVMNRQRLKQIQRDIFREIKNSDVFN